VRIETLAVHAGHFPDRETGAVVAPIHLSTTFEREPDLSFRAGHVYTRATNPNRQALEACIAQLEGGAGAACFSSGSAASNALLQALGAGAHVILPEDAFYGTTRLVRGVFADWGLAFTFVDMTKTENVARAITKNTRLVWIETPSNPLLRVADIAAVASAARTKGAWVVVDNTVATPILQRPLQLGADIVLHSATKAIAGHDDVLIGALVAADEHHPLFARARLVQRDAGAVPSPFECWLAMRGIRTLPLRVMTQSANAQRVAEFLVGHERVEAVHYPGLPSHPGSETALRQMSAPGVLLSLQVRGSREAAVAMSNRLRLITRATSLGGTASLIEHRHSIEGPDTRSPENLLRLSVGLEHPDDIIADLNQALTS
jgi:cystathionine gamma-synthase